MGWERVPVADTFAGRQHGLLFNDQREAGLADDRAGLILLLFPHPPHYLW